MTDFTPRPTVYNGIKMRSRLEAGFAMWLDEVGLEWEYEPECFASARGQYLPDFLLPHVEMVGIGDATLFVEVKPFQPEMELMQANLSIIRATVDKCFLVVCWPGGGWLFVEDDLEPADVLWVVAKFDDHGSKVGIALPSDAQPWPDGYWRPT